MNKKATKKDEKLQPKEKKVKQKKDKTQKSGKIFWQKVWAVCLLFLKGIWLVIKFILKYILFPFWITGVLLVKWFKFLRFRSKGPLTDDDKNFLSLIPHTFFMMGVIIVLFYLLFYLDVFDLSKNLTEPSFWKAVGTWFLDLWNGFVWLINIIFVTFLWNMIVIPFANVLSAHQWVSAAILLAAVIVGGGLIILFYNLIKKGKVIIWLKKIFGRFNEWILKTHRSVKEFNLKYLVGEKYVLTRSKNFFWTNVMFQTIITIAFFVFAIYMGVQRFFATVDPWTEGDVLRFAAYAGAILFVGVGIFATWFFTIVHGVSSEPNVKEE